MWWGNGGNEFDWFAFLLGQSLGLTLAAAIAVLSGV